MHRTDSALSLTTSRRESQNKNQRAQQSWDTSRCRRLIRPLTSKLRALNHTTQTLPSTTATVQPHKEKEVRLDPAELPYDPSTENATIKPSQRRRGADRGLFFGDNRRKALQRTYSSRNLAIQDAPLNIAPTAGPSTQSTSVYDQSFPDCAINWDTVLPPEPEEPRPVKKPMQKGSEAQDPQAALDSLKPFLHVYIFNTYIGIYNAFDSLLAATNCPRKGPPHLKDIAARKIARCIVATSEEYDDDDAWYDHAADVGVGGEYLREIVRWHGVEILRESIRSDFMPTQNNGMGLAGVLVGLCKFHGANAEAESLLRSMFELQPLSTNTTDPSLVALRTFWKSSPESVMRILAEIFACDGTPAAFGNVAINELLKTALRDIETCEVSKAFVSRALESVFGIWGERHVMTMTYLRKQEARRKTGRRNPSKKSSSHQKIKSPTLPARIGQRAEGMALDVTENLILESFKGQKRITMQMIEDIARGFLTQDEAVRTDTEDVWEEWFPIAAKVAILLRCFGNSSLEDSCIAKELVRCSACVRGETGKDGLKSLGEYIAQCYEKIYLSSTGKSISGKNEIGILVDKLLFYTRHIGRGSIPATPAHSFKTPIKPRETVIIFTPGKQDVNLDWQTERYYISQLAMAVALGFSTLTCAVSDYWVQWLASVERKVLGMKIRTPAKTLSRNVTPDDGKAERQGWRYEEGLGEWVATGATPGGALKKTRKPKTLVFDRVEITVDPNRKRNWRTGYIDYGEESDVETESISSVSADINFNKQPETEATANRDTVSNQKKNQNVVLQQHYASTPTTEGHNTSFSQIFDAQEDSSASEVETFDGKTQDEEFYAPTPQRPISSPLHRTPRSKARITKSLLKSVKRHGSKRLSQPMSSPLRSNKFEKGKSKAFDFSMVEDSSDDDFDQSQMQTSALTFQFPDAESSDGGEQEVDRNIPPTPVRSSVPGSNRQIPIEIEETPRKIKQESPPKHKQLKRKHSKFLDESENDTESEHDNTKLVSLASSSENARSASETPAPSMDGSFVRSKKIRRFEEIMAQEDERERRKISSRKKLFPVAPKNQKARGKAVFVSTIEVTRSTNKRRSSRT